MNEFDERLIDGVREPAVAKYRPLSWFTVPLIAIWFQVFVPRFIEYLSYLELPLLVTIYFSLMRRQPVVGSCFGAAVGLAQDSLSDHYVGMFGIDKTLVGFLAASMSLRFDGESPALRMALSFGLFVFHQFCYWGINRFLVGQNVDPQIPQIIIQGFLNGVVAVPLFIVLDRLREEVH